MGGGVVGGIYDVHLQILRIAVQGIADFLYLDRRTNCLMMVFSDLL